LSTLFTAKRSHVGRGRVLEASMVCGITPSVVGDPSTTMRWPGAARTHGGKRGVTGGIEEGDTALRGLD